MIRKTLLLAACTLTLGAAPAFAQVSREDVETRVAAVTPAVVAWRRDIHAHPELANRETRTAALVARHLRRLGMEVRTGVAHTGVVAVLRGARPGPVVALRAEMDALPVEEQTGLPFASRVRGEYQGQETFVAHACGHDAHVAMLMGAAQVLAGMRDQIAGTIVFVFQPAEEGAPLGEEGGARMMIAEGALADPAPTAIFGMHAVPGAPGTMFFRARGFMAASDRFDITLRGRQTHGAWPWQGVDIMSMTAAMISQFNQISARTQDLTRAPNVLTVSTVHGGVRYNIIPEEVKLSGTLRTFEQSQREDIKARVTRTANDLAEIYGATAEVVFHESAAVTFNDPALTAWATPVMIEAAGGGQVDAARPPTTVAEDFAYYQNEIPGVFVHLGASADGVDPATSPPNHSPQFNVNESILPLGVRAHVLFALRYLESGGLTGASAD